MKQIFVEATNIQLIQLKKATYSQLVAVVPARALERYLLEGKIIRSLSSTDDIDGSIIIVMTVIFLCAFNP